MRPRTGTAFGGRRVRPSWPLCSISAACHRSALRARPDCHSPFLSGRLWKRFEVTGRTEGEGDGGKQARLIKLSDARIHSTGVTSSRVLHNLRHGRVRLETVELNTSQQQTTEESTSLWCSLHGHHGRRFIRPRAVYTDEIRITRPQDFKSVLRSTVSTAKTSNLTWYSLSGHKGTRTWPRKSKEKVRHSRRILRKSLFPYTLSLPDLSD